jgi:hypothetical protein
VPIRSRTADEVDMTTDTHDERIAEDGLLPVGAAYAAGVEAVARIHDEALAEIARLADTWDSPEDDMRVVRLAERPAVALRTEPAAA